MAIVVLVLWMFTAGAGLYLLITSNLSRARPASALMAAKPAPAAGPAPVSVATHATQSTTISTASSVSPSAQGAAQQPTSAVQPTVQTSSVTPDPSTPPVSKRELRRATRDRFDPPSLTAAKNAPVVPGLRSLLEFAHPACAIVGLGFWLGYTLVHDRALGWIAFGLVTVTVCLGLTWYAANTGAAGHRDGTSRADAAGHRDGTSRADAVGRPSDDAEAAGRPSDDADAAGRPSDEEPRPSFGSRLVGLHGAAAAVTFVLAALTVLVLR